jgi:hypothetical protein
MAKKFLSEATVASAKTVRAYHEKSEKREEATQEKEKCTHCGYLLFAMDTLGLSSFALISRGDSPAKSKF